MEVNKTVYMQFNASDDNTIKPEYRVLKYPDGFELNQTTGLATWTPNNSNISEIRYFFNYSFFKIKKLSVQLFLLGEFIFNRLNKSLRDLSIGKKMKILIKKTVSVPCRVNFLLIKIRVRIMMF